MDKQPSIRSIMTLAPVIPVVIINDVSSAVSLARALVKGGLPAIEVTLRTPTALEALKAIADDVEGAIPGAGTVLVPQQISEVEKAGGRFMVSPGASPRLLDAAEDSAMPLLPGTATPSEMMALAERGYNHVKFFPASLAGGPKYLKALSSPLPQFGICPTGGINADNASEYLAVSTVLCVGGSWVAPDRLIQAQDWDGITALARQASKLG